MTLEEIEKQFDLVGILAGDEARWLIDRVKEVEILLQDMGTEEHIPYVTYYYEKMRNKELLERIDSLERDLKFNAHLLAK